MTLQNKQIRLPKDVTFRSIARFEGWNCANTGLIS